MTSTDIALSWGKIPVRVQIDPDGIWFAAADLYRVARTYTNRSQLSRFDPTHLRLLTFPGADGPVKLTAVSPQGAAVIAINLHPYQGRMMDGWIRRNANEIAAAHGLPPMTMSYLPDGGLPVRPKAVHDNYHAWKDLERNFYPRTVYPPRPNDPALQDEDTNLPPPSHSFAPSVYTVPRNATA